MDCWICIGNVSFDRLGATGFNWRSIAGLWLAWDAVADDPHRLAVVKQVFEQPLAVFEALERYQQAAQYSVDQVLIRAQRDLECDPYRAQSLLC